MKDKSDLFILNKPNFVTRPGFRTKPDFITKLLP